MAPAHASNSARQAGDYGRLIDEVGGSFPPLFLLDELREPCFPQEGNFVDAMPFPLPSEDLPRKLGSSFCSRTCFSLARFRAIFAGIDLHGFLRNGFIWTTSGSWMKRILWNFGNCGGGCSWRLEKHGTNAGFRFCFGSCFCLSAGSGSKYGKNCGPCSCPCLAVASLTVREKGRTCSRVTENPSFPVSASGCRPWPPTSLSTASQSYACSFHKFSRGKTSTMRSSSLQLTVINDMSRNWIFANEGLGVELGLLCILNLLCFFLIGRPCWCLFLRTDGGKRRECLSRPKN